MDSNNGGGTQKRTPRCCGLGIVQIFWLPLAFSLLACNTDTSTTAGSTVIQHYRVIPKSPAPEGQSSYIQTEYDPIIVIPGEERTFYVCGTTTHGANGEQYSFISDKFDALGSSNASEAIVQNANNSYWDDKTGEYTAPCHLTAPLIPGEYTYTIHLSESEQSSAGSDADLTATVDVEVVASRTFNVNYSYQIGYGFGSRGFYTSDDIATAFAGTNVTITTESTALQAETVPLQDRVSGKNIDEDDQYLEHYLPAPVPGDSRLILVSVNDLPDQTITGYTFEHLNSAGGWDHGNSFVFLQPIDNAFANVPSTTLTAAVGRGVTETTIHELGHLRSHLLIADGGTQENGVNANTGCVMVHLTNPPLSNTQIFALLSTPVFCEGHIQMLLNYSW